MSELDSHPTADASLLSAMRLHLANGVGPILHQRLISAFGSAERVLAATSQELQTVEGIGPKVALAIRVAAESSEATKELARCAAAGIQIISSGSENYPHSLNTIPDPPQLLYCRGSLLPRDQLAIGVVGSRRCTLYGTQQAEKLSAALARAGVTIISGLARGIDAAAHRGALAGGGRTIAVLATGVETIYPEEHAELAQTITKSGAIVSESKLDQHPSPGLFPQRNRIISGMSMAVLIIEATRNSGALHTARHAIEQGREVLVVPGRIDSLASEGCLDLLRDGATLIRHADDVMQALGPFLKAVPTASHGEVRSARELILNDQERAVLNLVTDEPQHLDEILRSSSLDPSRVLATITVLEMKRLVRRMPGSFVVRAPY